MTDRMRDFGARDTLHISRFLEHSGASAMATQVCQRWTDQEALRAAVRFAVWLCENSQAADFPTAKAYFERVLRVHHIDDRSNNDTSAATSNPPSTVVSGRDARTEAAG